MPPQPQPHWRLGEALTHAICSGTAAAAPRILCRSSTAPSQLKSDVTSPAVVQRGFVDSVVRRIGERLSSARAGVELLKAPSGEGKTTALMQAATTLAQEPSITVIVRTDPNAPLTRELLSSAAPAGESCVIVADTAHTLMASLDTIIMQGTLASPCMIQLIIASRDTDWDRAARRLGRFDPATRWQQRVAIHSDHGFGALYDRGHAPDRQELDRWRRRSILARWP